MAEKTIMDAAGETVGIGMAMVSDMADAVKTAVSAVAGVVKKAPARKAAKKTVTRKPARKAPAKKAAKKTAARKTLVKKAAKKSVRKPAKKVKRPVRKARR